MIWPKLINNSTDQGQKSSNDDQIGKGYMQRVNPCNARIF